MCVYERGHRQDRLEPLAPCGPPRTDCNPLLKGTHTSHAGPWHHCCVNVNTTDATTGATALLLPVQNTHTCVPCVSRLPAKVFFY